MYLSQMAAFLRPAEQEALAAYEALARCFADRPALVTFLRQLAKDEATHLELLRRAEEQFRAGGEDRQVSLRLDEQTTQAVHGLSQLLACAQTGQLTEAELLAGIVHAEFSEWNEVFLYVLSCFRKGEPEFQRAAAVVHQHKRHIEEYQATCPASVRLPNLPPPLPEVWQQRMLVVDDEEALRLLLQVYLRDRGEVTVAANGAEGLVHAQNSFFDVILTDVDMPQLSGLDFYHALAATGSPNRHRFIFMTADASPAVRAVARDAAAVVLEKPFMLQELAAAVQKVLTWDN